MQQREQYQELVKLGPFLGIDQTSSTYNLNPAYALDGINFDPSNNFKSLSLCPGRTLVSPPNQGPVVFLNRDTTSFAFFYEPYGTDSQTYATEIIGYSFAERVPAFQIYEPFQQGPVQGTLAFPPTWPNQSRPPNGVITGNIAKFAQFMGYMYINTNGAGASPYGGIGAIGDIPLKVAAGSLQLTMWQIAPPPNPPSVTSSGAGYLTGEYYWRATFASSVSGQESSPSPIFGATGGTGIYPVPITLDNQQVTLTFAPMGLASDGTIEAFVDPQVDTINIYRLGGTSQIWTQVGSVTGNIQTLLNDTFVDNTPDAPTSNQTGLTGAALIEHQDPPPNFNAICIHKNRMWGLGYNYPYPWNFTSQNKFVTQPAQPSDLWFSAFNQPGSFDCVNQVLSLDREANADSGVGLMSLNSVLLAIKKQTTWATYGDTAEDFYPIKIFDIGCAFPLSISQWESDGFWANMNGVYRTNAQQIENISDGTDDDNPSGIKGLLLPLLNQPNNRVVGFCINQSYYIWETTTNTGWGYYIPLRRWTSVQFSYAPSIFANDSKNNLLYALNYPSNELDSWFSGVADAYGPIVGTWTTGNFDSDSPHLIKEYVYAMVQIPPSDPESNFQLSFYVDGNQFGPYKLTPRPSVPVGGNSNYRITFPPGLKGTNLTIQIIATQVGSIPILLDRISVYGQITEEFAPVYDEYGST